MDKKYWLLKEPQKTFINTARIAAKSNAEQKIKRNLKDAAINMVIDSIQGKDVKTSPKNAFKESNKRNFRSFKTIKQTNKKKTNIKNKARKR